MILRPDTLTHTDNSARLCQCVGRRHRTIRWWRVPSPPPKKEEKCHHINRKCIRIKVTLRPILAETARAVWMSMSTANPLYGPCGLNSIENQQNSPTGRKFNCRYFRVCWFRFSTFSFQNQRIKERNNFWKKKIISWTWWTVRLIHLTTLEA